MATVEIPNDVLEQLQAVHQSQHDLSGWFRAEDVREATGWGRDKTGNALRALLREGTIEVRKFTMTEPEAHAIGLLGACHVRMYRFKEQP